MTVTPDGDVPTDPEDIKMITLASSALARTRATDAGSVRDTDGRTYVGVAVDLEHLKLSGLQVAVAMAVSSGSTGLEAIAVLGDHDPTPDEERAVSEVGSSAGQHMSAAGVRLWLCDEQGRARRRDRASHKESEA